VAAVEHSGSTRFITQKIYIFPSQYAFLRRKTIIFLNTINWNGLGKRKLAGKRNGLVITNTVLKI
jgi:hypothetical protein